MIAIECPDIITNVTMRILIVVIGVVDDGYWDLGGKCNVTISAMCSIRQTGVDTAGRITRICYDGVCFCFAMRKGAVANFSTGARIIKDSRGSTGSRFF